MSRHYGRTEPRLWTKPLRELTPETSLGYEVIDFARQILHIELYPWQQWLLIHALELLEDGITYRYRRIIVLVGRQNGKTLVASVLAAWWLHVDSQRHPDRVPPLRFKIVGTARTSTSPANHGTASNSGATPNPKPSRNNPSPSPHCRPQPPK